MDDLDFGSGGEPPRTGGVKLWQLIAFLTTLFAAHYLLVQATINSALKDFEMRSIGVNAAANMQMQDMQRRIGNLEQFDQTTITRMASQESSDRDLEKRLTLVEERQRQVMAKIGLANNR